MLFVLIPIPLELPLGHEWTQMVIRDGRVIGAKLRHTHSGGGILGWTVRSPIDDFGFHSLSRFQSYVPNQSVEPTGGSRFCQADFVGQLRLPPMAHAEFIR
jgi:hypothetical protein